MSLDASLWAWKAPVQSSTQRLVLLSLADRAGEDHTCYPSAARLRQDTLLNRKTILGAISDLIELGLVKDTGKKVGNGVRVLKLINVNGRETLNRTDTNIGTSTKNGTSTDLGMPTDTNIGMPTSTNIGTQNLSMNLPRNLPINKGKKPRSEKQNSFDAKSIELPENVNRDLWIQFVDMRISIKKPLTENAVKLLMKKLKDYGVGANESLENSIIGSYQGLYAPKQQFAQSTSGQQNNQSQEPSYFDQVFDQYQQSDVIDVTPDFAVTGGFNHA